MKHRRHLTARLKEAAPDSLGYVLKAMPYHWKKEGEQSVFFLQAPRFQYATLKVPRVNSHQELDAEYLAVVACVAADTDFIISKSAVENHRISARLSS